MPREFAASLVSRGGKSGIIGRHLGLGDSDGAELGQGRAR
jgi:hypothetical protein